MTGAAPHTAPLDRDLPIMTVPTMWHWFPSAMPRRWWLFRLFDLLVRYFPVFGAPRGLVVIRMDGIGDMMLFRRSLDHYADAFGVDKGDITVIGCNAWASIADEVFAGYRVISINEHRFAKRPFYRLRVAWQVRRLNARVAVCDQYLRRAMMADSLVWLSGAPDQVVCMPYVNEPTRSLYTWYLSQVTRIIDTGPYPTHEIVRHAHFVSAIAGRKIAPEPTALPWAGVAPSFDIGAPYAVMNPGSNEPGRRWPLASYLDVAQRLLERGWHVVFVGTGTENWDGDLAADVAAHARVHDLTGRTNLPELIAVMRDAALVVSNDTGPAHLSIAVGAPTVVIVGGGHFTSFVPYPADISPATARFVFEEMECYHCFWRCHLRDNDTAVFPCIDRITPDTVWAACEELIGADPSMRENA